MSGHKRMETPYKGDKIDGVVVMYREDGTKKSEEEYKNSKIDGEVTKYFEDEMMWSKTQWKNNKKAGLEIFRTKDGVINDTLITEHHSNGEKKTETTFKNG